MKTFRGILAAAVAILVTVPLTAGIPATGAPKAAGPQSSNARLEMYEAVVDGATAAQLADQGHNIVSTEQVQDGVRIVLVLYPWQRTAIEKQGVDLTLWTNTEGVTATELAAQQEAAGFKVWRDYDGTDGIRAYLEQIAAANPDLLKLEVIGQTWGTDPEGDGPDTPREIVALKLTKDAGTVQDNTRPAVLYSSLQHAREWISVEVNRRLLEHVIKMYREGKQDFVDLVSNNELWFVLVANPDGYQYTFDYDRLWRKNLRDNDGDNQITPLDGVDPNRNYPEHWNFDDEGSASIFTDETYRGPAAGSEPETQAMMSLFDRIDFRFQVNYHSFGELLLYTFGFQVNTPSADDPIYVALSGTDAKPAINGYNPGVGADLYTTNGETTDFAHAVHGVLAWTPELGDGPHDDGFVFPDKEGQVQAEFSRNLPFALDVASSAADPDDPVSHTKIEVEPFYLNTAEIDPQKSHNPLSDFRFAYSYDGASQPVQILAKRDINGDGNPDDVTVHWSIDGGPAQSGATGEWGGGDRYGGPGDIYYHIVRGTVTGAGDGDNVTVWFTGGGATSDSFTYQVVGDSPAEVLVVAAEDYTGTSNVEPYPPTNGPHYLEYYTDALTANGVDFDVYDVDARSRIAPDSLGVLGHYEAVVWYTGNDLLTREPGQPGGTGAATLANNEMLELRAYLNEGGRLLYTGRHAGWQYANAFDYNPITTPPYCDNVDQTVDDGCLLLSDDFLQYWLGAQLFIEDGGTDAETGEPVPLAGTALGAFDGLEWTLNGGDSADNHHPNASRGTTQSFLTTSSLQKADDYPQFNSDSFASWQTGVAGAFSPHTGSYYLYSDRADLSYKRLTRTIDLTGVDAGASPELSFWTSYDTEADWDFMFVEAHTVGQDDWTTLPDANGHTSQNLGDPAVGNSCSSGWHTDPNNEIHPFLAHYQTWNGPDAACDPVGTTGEWNAASGRSNGWQDWSIDLSGYAGSQVELSISYVSDWAVQGIGAFLDDITLSTEAGTESFETDLGAWNVTGPAPGSAVNGTDWTRTTDVGYEEGAVVTMAPTNADFRTLYFGFGFEGVTSAEERNELMGRAIDYLLVP
ncbi:MAG TPA: M14 family zinc carboxypeptidase [Jiangellaceae bacterium]|nr:M14 family zinc carboxypeptidase [Jiangellaceae bacterium]